MPEPAACVVVCYGDESHDESRHRHLVRVVLARDSVPVVVIAYVVYRDRTFR